MGTLCPTWLGLSEDVAGCATQREQQVQMPRGRNKFPVWGIGGWRNTRGMESCTLSGLIGHAKGVGVGVT